MRRVVPPGCVVPGRKREFVVQRTTALGGRHRVAGTANEAEGRHGILSLRQYRLLKFVFTVLGIVAVVYYWYFLTIQENGAQPVDAIFYWRADPSNLYPHAAGGLSNGYVYTPAFEFLAAPWRVLPFLTFVAIYRAILLGVLFWLAGPLTPPRAARLPGRLRGCRRQHPARPGARARAESALAGCLGSRAPDEGDAGSGPALPPPPARVAAGRHRRGRDRGRARGGAHPVLGAVAGLHSADVEPRACGRAVLPAVLGEAAIRGGEAAIRGGDRRRRSLAGVVVDHARGRLRGPAGVVLHQPGATRWRVAVASRGCG